MSKEKKRTGAPCYQHDSYDPNCGDCYHDDEVPAIPVRREQPAQGEPSRSPDRHTVVDVKGEIEFLHGVPSQPSAGEKPLHPLDKLAQEEMADGTYDKVPQPSAGEKPRYDKAKNGWNRDWETDNIPDDMTGEQPTVETAWLLEKEINGQPHWIGVIDYFLNWTPDPNKALRLARREDADKLAEICEDADRCTEHQWINR